MTPGTLVKCLYSDVYVWASREPGNTRHSFIDTGDLCLVLDSEGSGYLVITSGMKVGWVGNDYVRPVTA